ncbi:flagellar basal-body MS-ring/collar protein FliF [Novosphingobium mangrovi (ex Huang et al. 2023)]|uniref:Flagellar M-ring protein n=1 Tax=Novosphingobium mangrovi (ex Huang et al. 2023) TaxID=2976432 RepID=A0ABT2I038_9SPHN|nr:flagellar basal-body MS-ring/collar protein FliF [Novosphingobium mangrovi (ex Huang et al. 2023)]MCT2398169.1 flagellar basal-body MS-ring/collar protein FliF [Novosphingobium mangrovi (ex Huang et al. 2023)]
MSDLVPATPDGPPGSALPASASLFTPLTDPAGGSILTRLSAFTAQPAVKKMLPAFIGVTAIGGALLAWSAMSPDPQRTLYSQLDDSERAGVAAALDQASIGYHIDNTTGALTVAESDFYKARMLVASDGALATPETGDDMLDKLPMGASRTLEGERLRSARERDLQLTIGEIDGVSSVRVHLAEGEKSVFVRDNVPPTASVMVRMKTGRQLSESQVAAIVNLVAGSVPGLSPDSVRVIDQHGRLLSEAAGIDSDRLDLQTRMESKLREQVSQLLLPVLGEGNFTSEIQVQLNMDEVTSARESYDKDGVVRSESEQQSKTTGAAQAASGVPGVLANTPPIATQVQPGAPQGTQPAAPGMTPPTSGESSSTRTYELGRQVSVSSSRPGSVRRLSVAVAISAEAMKDAKEGELKDLEALISAAVGADPQRGDQVKVLTRAFEPMSKEPVSFYETGWFAMLVRNGAAVLAVLLVLLLGVRPMVKALRGDKPAKAKPAESSETAEDGESEDETDGADEAVEDGQPAMPSLSHRPNAEDISIEINRSDLLTRQLDLAQRLVNEQPASAVAALRQMLNEPPTEDEPKQEAA